MWEEEFIVIMPWEKTSLWWALKQVNKKEGGGDSIMVITAIFDLITHSWWNVALHLQEMALLW